MLKTHITIPNKLGLHARASAKFVATAAKYQSELIVKKDSQTVNGKSIMGVMGLTASQGTVLTLEFNGPDEQQMAEAIVNLIKQKFGEEE